MILHAAMGRGLKRGKSELIPNLAQQSENNNFSILDLEMVQIIEFSSMMDVLTQGRGRFLKITVDLLKTHSLA